MSSFQLKLAGEWRDYSSKENQILKRAFMAGHPCVKFSVRGQHYEYNFQRMVQKNLSTNKEREIRPPHMWRLPAKPLVPPGRTACVKVPSGSTGTIIKVPHPDDPCQCISVRVPESAKAGQAMLVPVPRMDAQRDQGASHPASNPIVEPAPAIVAVAAEATSGARSGLRNIAKAAAGAAAVVSGVVIGVSGSVVGESITTHGLETTVDASGDIIDHPTEATVKGIVDASEHIVDGAEVADDLIVGAADSPTDSTMDFF